FSSDPAAPLAAGSSDFRPFSAQPGEIDVTLVTATSPTLGNPVVAVVLGSASTDGSACNYTASNPGSLLQTGQGFSVSAAGAGGYCVAILDSFSQGPITWTIQVMHH